MDPFEYFLAEFESMLSRHGDLFMADRYWCLGSSFLFNEANVEDESLATVWSPVEETGVDGFPSFLLG